MLLKIGHENQYYLDQSKLPEILCEMERKNRAVLVGRMISAPVSSADSMRTLSLVLEGEKEPLEVLAKDELIRQESPVEGCKLLVDGEFVTWYRTLRKYRPLIKVLARRLILLEEGTEFHKIFSNRVYIEGVIAENPVVVTSMQGNRTIKASILSGGSKIPCAIREDAVQSFDEIQRDGRYKMWGRLATRTYQKRLGRGRFEVDTMSEVQILELKKLNVIEPELKKTEFVTALNQTEFYIQKR